MIKNFLKVLGLVVVAVFALSSAFVQQDQQQDEQAEGEVRLMVIETREPGSYLADGEGRTLYTLVAEEDEGETTGGAEAGGTEMATDELNPRTLPCIDQCAVAWPPFMIADGAEMVDLAADLDAALLGTTTRPDGTTQVTYNGWPLHYFILDEEPGDHRGQGVRSFGGIWYVLSAEIGEPLETEAEQNGL